MQEEIKKINQEVIDAQKDAVVKEVATISIQRDFISKDIEERIKEAEKIKNKEEKETALENLNKDKLQRLHPMEDNIEYKTKYYDYLCSL